jgi:peptide chain release factor
MWIFLTSGTGPDECQIAVGKLVGILCDEARQNNIDPILLDMKIGDHGLYSVLLAIEGDDLEQFAASWEGTIKWSCPSPIRKGWPRKNWFVSCSVIRPPEQSSFKETELRFETFRASGPGGQHVQKTDSAVRVIHEPTGMTAQAQEERSQYRNKALAVARLAGMFAQQNTDAKAAVKTEIWSKHYTLERGNESRFYKGLDFRRV